jgi:hypothetical protein
MVEDWREGRTPLEHVHADKWSPVLLQHAGVGNTCRERLLANMSCMPHLQLIPSSQAAQHGRAPALWCWGYHTDLVQLVSSHCEQALMLRRGGGDTALLIGPQGNIITPTCNEPAQVTALSNAMQ